MNVRLQYYYRYGSTLAVYFNNHSLDYRPGDCYVRAIKGTTNASEHNATELASQVYSNIFSLEEAKKHIESLGKEALGNDVKRCLGLTLEDEDQKIVFFDEPIILEKKVTEIKIDRLFNLEFHGFSSREYLVITEKTKNLLVDKAYFSYCTIELASTEVTNIFYQQSPYIRLCAIEKNNTILNDLIEELKKLKHEIVIIEATRFIPVELIPDKKH